MKKLSKSKKARGEPAPPPSRHISAKEVRYMSRSDWKKPQKKADSGKRYDKQLATSRNKLMFNLRLMACIYIFLIVFNVASPLYLSGALAYKSFFQKVICVVHTYNILSAWGWFKHKFATVWWILVRAVEVLFYIFIRPERISWYFLGVLVILDFLFLIVFWYDTTKYEEVDKPVAEGMEM